MECCESIEKECGILSAIIQKISKPLWEVNKQGAEEYIWHNIL
jgi:hypothetical protein